MLDIQEPGTIPIYGALHPFDVQWNTIIIRVNGILGLLVIIILLIKIIFILDISDLIFILF